MSVLLAGGIALSAVVSLARPAFADPARAARSEASARDVLDVVLTGSGRLAGCAVDRGGVPLSNEHVVLRRHGTSPQRTLTDRQGRFHFDGVPQGVYNLDVADQSSAIRAWSPAAAPPSARTQPIFVAGGPIVRGQTSGDAALGVVTLGATAAGVTIATLASENGAARTPFIQPPGSTAVGPFRAGQIDTGNTPIHTLHRVTLDTTGADVHGIGPRRTISP